MFFEFSLYDLRLTTYGQWKMGSNWMEKYLQPLAGGKNSRVIEG
jgi:hypothetical protein